MKDYPQKVKLTIAFDRDLHAAATELAHNHHRSFTGELNHVLEQHVKNAEEAKQVV